jgi:hypothetical protein
MNSNEQLAPKKLIRDMSFAEAVAADEMTSGRNWMHADFYALTDFGDCARAEVYWADGAATYMLHDSKDEAQEHLNALGAFAKIAVAA